MRRDRREIAGWLLVGISLLYLWMFMPRGWVPHDEGMLGQSAEHILLGHLPHVDYQEPYTGGLSLLHAAAFKVFGVDLVHLRWILFAAFAAIQLLIYVILRRFLEPIGAALVAMLSLTWSFPNYFASLPSWWVLLCAIVCVWAFIRYTETGSLRFAAGAGLAAGLSIAFKQTGLYILVALVMAFLYGRGHRVVRLATALGSTCLAMAILKIRMTSTESVYLLLPIVACGILLGASGESDSDRGQDAHRAAALAVLWASLPLVACLIPYLTGGRLEPLLNGLFILPQKRLQFASLPMTQVGYILLGVPCVALVLPIARRIHLTAMQFVVALTGLSVVAAIAIVVSFDRYAAYQLFWQSGRAFAALLPVAVSWLLAVRSDFDKKQRRILFCATAMLAWASLVQFPFSGAIYFCYAAPLAVIAGAACARYFSNLRNPALLVWCASLAVFAVLTMNRGYLDSLGAWHQPIAFDTRLDMPRGHLNVRAEEAQTYRRVAELVAEHIGRGRLIAGPDSPEVYFLVDRLSRTGTFFDFFADGEDEDEEALWLRGRVVVLNQRPQFSTVPSQQLAARIREQFPYGEAVGRFEVRWR